MMAHVVLFRPRTDLSGADRTALAAAFEDALRAIPSIQRVNVGRRVMLGRPYEALMKSDYPYAAVLEFEDRASLMAYLEHPAHERLAARFFTAFEDALIYDFELRDATAGLATLLSDAQ